MDNFIVSYIKILFLDIGLVNYPSHRKRDLSLLKKVIKKVNNEKILE
jgi:hypothetical protein